MLTAIDKMAQHAVNLIQSTPVKQFAVPTAQSSVYLKLKCLVSGSNGMPVSDMGQ
jgi:hypothetical protein